MFRNTLFLFISYLEYENCFGFLIESEKRITLELVKHFDVQQLVLVEDFDNKNRVNLNYLKDFLKWNKPLIYLPPAGIYEYFLKESKSGNIARIAVVFKVPNIIKTIVGLFKYLYIVSIAIMRM